MAYPVSTYSNFIVIQKPQHVAIKAKLARTFPEIIGVFAMYWFPVVLVLTLLHVPSVYAYLLSVIIGIILMVLFDTYLMGVIIMLVDEKEGVLTEMGSEKFEVKSADIKDVSIVEETAKEGTAQVKLYRLKYVLADGEKTSGFAFTSYNKLEELLNLLKTAANPQNLLPQ